VLQEQITSLFELNVEQEAYWENQQIIWGILCIHLLSAYYPVWDCVTRYFKNTIQYCESSLWTRNLTNIIAGSMGCTRNPIHLLSANTTKPQGLPVTRSWYSPTDAKSWTNRALSTHVCSILSCIHSSTSNLTNSPQSIGSLLPPLKLEKCNPFSIPLTPVAKHTWYETGRRVTHYLLIRSRPCLCLPTVESTLYVSKFQSYLKQYVLVTGPVDWGVCSSRIIIIGLDRPADHRDRHTCLTASQSLWCLHSAPLLSPDKWWSAQPIFGIM
jgi:hypothetical protein